MIALTNAALRHTFVTFACIADLLYLLCDGVLTGEAATGECVSLNEGDYSALGADIVYGIITLIDAT